MINPTVPGALPEAAEEPKGAPAEETPPPIAFLRWGNTTWGAPFCKEGRAIRGVWIRINGMMAEPPRQTL